MNPNEEVAGGGGVWWLSLFLARTFFQACGAHTNHENHYCIDCETAACNNCLAQGTHAHHRVITIYRLVHKDVVALDQMNQHIDCSRIQPYASNGRQVLALHPLPHCNSGQLNQDRACRTCTRILMNPNRYSYCSIACKPSIKPAAADHGGAGTYSGKSRRKGVPQRAPLF